MLTSIERVFLDFGDARGLGLLFVVCACAVGLRGNRLIGTRGTWGVVWRSAHVPTIPFTWLRRANAWTPSAHASNYQALLSIKLCKQCRFNSCVRVFFIPMGHVVFHGQFDVILVTWAKCAILIGREPICCALIGYRLQGPSWLLWANSGIIMVIRPRGFTTKRNKILQHNDFNY